MKGILIAFPIGLALWALLILVSCEVYKHL